MVRTTAARVRAAYVELDLAALRWLGLAMLVLGVALPHAPHDPGLPCPLKTVTGVPCPMCGMTTSVKALMKGHFGSAWSANPFGYLAVATAVLLLTRPSWRRMKVPLALIVAVAVVSELFQLRRFGFI